MAASSVSPVVHRSTIGRSPAVTDRKESSFVQSAIVLLGRLLFAAIFLLTAPKQFTDQMIGFAASQGVPLASIAVPAAGVLSLLGGLSILLGYRAKIGAWLIVLFLVPVTLMLHNFWAITDPMLAQNQMAHFMKNISMLGAALLMTQLGSGPWSLDARSSAARQNAD